ncbi:hypothetical protein K466DRAFT_594912 [Polyporus arcularius HHB13444]|uniref:Uncharacterized protein n=1 Tax=Polyporus arcularius HHB13444 TaxID=1314778 RepID=A0A5C3PTD4_9APHY|nr:hypothetical protein K466DRAFT_594912 [Polyporus arcularius HHB13444]
MADEFHLMRSHELAHSPLAPAFHLHVPRPMARRLWHPTICTSKPGHGPTPGFGPCEARIQPHICSTSDHGTSGKRKLSPVPPSLIPHPISWEKSPVERPTNRARVNSPPHPAGASGTLPDHMDIRDIEKFLDTLKNNPQLWTALIPVTTEPSPLCPGSPSVAPHALSPLPPQDLYAPQPMPASSANPLFLPCPSPCSGTSCSPSRALLLPIDDSDVMLVDTANTPSPAKAAAKAKPKHPVQPSADKLFKLTPDSAVKISALTGTCYGIPQKLSSVAGRDILFTGLSTGARLIEVCLQRADRIMQFLELHFQVHKSNNQVILTDSHIARYIDDIHTALRPPPSAQG